MTTFVQNILENQINGIFELEIIKKQSLKYVLRFQIYLVIGDFLKSYF